MRTLVLDPAPPDLAEALERRKRLGQDGYDEVWEGVYHVAPMVRSRHGWLQLQLVRILAPHADAAGLVTVGPVNIGDGRHNFRVPDLVFLRELIPDQLYLPTAAVVVEVVSPGDETYEKFAFYAAHDVDEVLVVDPDAHSVDVFVRGDSEYVRAGRSGLLSIDAAELESQLRWQ